MKKIQWLFFDVGSTLVDESICYEDCLRQSISGTSLTFDEVYDFAVDCYRRNLKGDKEVLRHYGLPKPVWHPHLEKVYPDAADCLKQLHAHYHIGIIANQYIGLSERLASYGLLEHIDLVISSEESSGSTWKLDQSSSSADRPVPLYACPLKKPDPAIFLLALEKANCRPEEAVMIGDRLDNDIVPAKALGMKTAWIRQGFGGLASIRTPQEQADYILQNLNEALSCFIHYI